MALTTPQHDFDTVPEPADGPPDRTQEKVWREWMMVATGLTALVAVIAAAVALVAFATNGKTTTVVHRASAAKTVAPATAIAAAPKLAEIGRAHV